MIIEAYHAHLLAQDLAASEIEERLAVAEDFVQFLTGPGVEPASDGKAAVDLYARKLIVEGRSSAANYWALCDFTRFLGLRRLYVALIEVLDCHNALAMLADRIEERHGRAVRERVFRGPLPPLGADERERWVYTQAVMERMELEIGPEDIRAAWFQVQNGLPPEAWQPLHLADQEKYRQCGSLDAFLDLKRRERDEMLARLHAENELWYSVLIDEEVLAYITSDPEMEVGRREGDRVYISKVPYNAHRYLQESDPQLKRYYACHCPLVREAILQDRPVNRAVCACSLGHASHYLAGLGQDLRGEVLMSAVQGDPRCRFVFHLSDS